MAVQSLGGTAPLLRTCVAVAGVMGAAALTGCADREPTGLGSAAGPMFSDTKDCSGAGALTLIAQSPGNPGAVEGKTAFLIEPHSAGWTRLEAEIVNGEATFCFPSGGQFSVGDRVIAGIEFNHEDNFAEQRTTNGNALFAPFNVGTTQLTPFSNDLTYYSAFYVAVGGNNTVPKTVDNLNSILANATNRSWITLTSSPQKLQPMSYPQGASGYAPGRVRSRIIDRNGNTVAFSGNTFGVQPLILSDAAKAAGYAFKCDPTAYSGDAARQAWFCALPPALFAVEGTANNGTLEFVLPDGAYILDIKGKDNNGKAVNVVRPGRVGSGATDESNTLAVPPVRSSYVMGRYLPADGPQVPYSRSGFEIDGVNNLAGFIQGYWTFEKGPITVRWTFVENPGPGSKTTVVELNCGTAIATGCKQVSGGKTTYLHGGTYSNGSGQGVVSIPQGKKTTTACVRAEVKIGSGYAPVPASASGDPLNACTNAGYPGYTSMNVNDGYGNTFQLM